jgi:hypothetical protein
MGYIVQRQDRFYVVAYDGLDSLTGRERRRWHSIVPARIGSMQSIVGALQADTA